MGLRLSVAVSAAALLLTAGDVHADKVYLQGGSVIEGKVSETGGKVVVELEAGIIRLAASSVVRIEKGETALEEIDARRAALRADDVVGRLALADRCREEQLPKCERDLLREIVALAPDHAEVRRRLGYVRGEHGWELARAAPEASEASSPAARSLAAKQAAELRQAELARDAAELSRQQAELALSTQRLLLRAAEEDALQRQAGFFVVPWLPARPWRGSSGALPAAPPQVTPYAINGVRDPAQTGFSLPGVRDLASYFPKTHAP